MAQISQDWLGDYRPDMMERLVPAHLCNGLTLYIEDGVQPGSGLIAVLSNDLREAATRLDDASLAGLRGLIQFLNNYAPSPCWGSSGNVNQWRAERGLNGRARKRAGEEE